jgi:hypothetical protein
MNKELILKYKTEFDHWLNGGKLRHKAYGKWEQTNNIWSCRTADIAAVVIDDQYVEFRKALAEGKIVQIAGLNPTAHPTIYKNSYVDMEGGLFDKAIELYRIKPEETI